MSEALYLDGGNIKLGYYSGSSFTRTPLWTIADGDISIQTLTYNPYGFTCTMNSSTKSLSNLSSGSLYFSGVEVEDIHFKYPKSGSYAQEYYGNTGNGAGYVPSCQEIRLNFNNDVDITIT